MCSTAASGVEPSVQSTPGLFEKGPPRRTALTRLGSSQLLRLRCPLPLGLFHAPSQQPGALQTQATPPRDCRKISEKRSPGAHPFDDAQRRCRWGQVETSRPRLPSPSRLLTPTRHARAHIKPLSPAAFTHKPPLSLASQPPFHLLALAFAP
ncbi:hypothetical protein SEVIR_9G209455v4 [Setaria viridis]